MATYTLHANIPEDRRLVVELPPDAPTGEAEVTVTVAEGEVGPETGLLELLDSWKRHPYSSGRTREEVDADIQAMREEWDDD